MNPKLLLITLFQLCFFLGKAQHTIVLQPDANSSKNAVITNYTPTTRHPVDSIFQGSAWTFSGTPVLFRSLLQFDLSQIPTNATIDSAFLSLYGFIGPNDWHEPLSGSNESVLMRITSSWNENTVTWNTQPTTVTTDQVTLPMSNFAGENYLHYDIKNMVKYWVANPTSNYGMFYRLVTEQYYRRMSFCSPVIADSAKRPMLTIHYSVKNTSVAQLPLNTGIMVSPNPSHDIINISLQKSIRHGEISFLNQIGQKVYSEPFDGANKSIHFNLKAGVYFVQVRDNEGQYSQKIIVN